MADSEKINFEKWPTPQKSIAKFCYKYYNNNDT